MPREQVRGVIAHELAHVRNRDVLVATIAAMIGAAISAIANFLQFQWLFGGGDDDESPLGIVGTIAAIIIAPIAAMLLQLAVSRQREYLADQTAAELLGEGRPLATRSARWRAASRRCRWRSTRRRRRSTSRTRSVRGGRGMASLFSTHPPIPVRIERLRAFDAKRGIHY